MLLQSRDGAASIPVATFHALRMLTNDWLQPGGGIHQAFRVQTNLSPADRPSLSAFAVKRPDGEWSVLLINKDTARPARITLPQFTGRSAATLVTYSSEEYQWKAAGPNGHPLRNAPPARKPVSTDAPIVLPPWSLSVLRTN
jgi:hypothetical protein